jgi:hypothetical protein
MAGTGFDNSPGFAENLVNNVAGNAAGIFSLRPNAKFLSGPRITLKINGKLVGFAFGISWNINTQFAEIQTIDDYLPKELAPQRITVDGTISAMHIPGISATTLQWQPHVLSFLFAPYISIEVRDSANNEIVFATDKAVIITRSEELKTDSLANVTLRWRAIGFLDEKTPAPMTNYENTLQQATNPVNTNPAAPPLQVPSLGSGLQNVIKTPSLF